ncbi:MAG: CHASE3 domain-containing protein, partial [Bacteroidota bacterium]|nr:CHASE3 domain-containing protein [Bacteroidota bacterium]
MAKTNKIQKARYGLIVSLSILCINLYIVFTVNRKNNEQARMAMHSAQVIANLERIYARINELESTQRGYIITHDRSFLNSFNDVRLKLKEEMLKLKLLEMNNQKQLKKINELTQLINEQGNWLQLNAVNNHSGRLLMGTGLMLKVLLKIGNIREIEEVKMKKEIFMLRQWSNWSTLVIIISVMIAAVLTLIAYLILINEYITKLKVEQELLRYQRQLNEKIEKLDLSNSNLEQFAYVASHDLQEPLRKILTFNEIISQKFASVTTPDLKNYLQRISGAADRMRVLIDDLLSYSKAMKGGIEMEKVNLEKVINICKDNCEVIIQNRKVIFIQHGTLPEIYGDETQIIQLFQNLISNAIKFTKEEVQPVIEIGCTLLNSELLDDELMNPLYSEYYKITIKDNGIGFNEKDLKKIFVIFQRLHGRSEFEGTG